MSKVLVTGGSGFLAGHIILRLLQDGYAVRTTLRSLAREAEVRALLAAAGAPEDAELSFALADLLRDEGWDDAASGCDFVMHVASPFPAAAPAHEDELIVPAREGTLRALRAARAAEVKRVVLTSSFAAVGYGHPARGTPFDERDWSDVEKPGIPAYVKSKTLAERAAWDFVQGEGCGMELAVVNPTAIFGPVLGPDLAASTLIVRLMLEGRLRRVPRVTFGVCDARDIADLHVRAMLDPAAAGERFLGVSDGGAISMAEGARAVLAQLGDAAAGLSVSELPDWFVRLAALFDERARRVAPDLGKKRSATSAKAQRLLGWRPRSREEALTASAQSILWLGLVRRR